MAPIYTTPVIELEEPRPRAKPKLPSLSLREAAAGMLRDLADLNDSPA
jgi:hypothetical protein